jgi:hypothetical protein
MKVVFGVSKKIPRHFATHESILLNYYATKAYRKSSVKQFVLRCCGVLKETTLPLFLQISEIGRVFLINESVGIPQKLAGRMKIGEFEGGLNEVSFGSTKEIELRLSPL